MHPRNGDGSAGPGGRAGVALGRWHGAFRGAAPAVLRPHTIERESEALRRQAGRADPAHEDQVLIGERVGLIDLDDAALGPPELDVCNLAGHLDLLQIRSGRDLQRTRRSLLLGYVHSGARLDVRLFERVRVLIRLRLACIHGGGELLETPVRA
jgi:hypothetical protein